MTINGKLWRMNKMETNQKFRVVFNDGTELIKTRWDIAIFSITSKDNFLEKDGIITYSGINFSFIAYPIKENE